MIKNFKTKGTEDIFEPSWLYGDDEQSPESLAAEKILDKTVKLLDIRGLRIIITLNSIHSLE